MSTTAVRVTRTEELSGVIRSAVVTVVGSATTGPIGPVGPTGPTGPTGATGPVVPLDGLLDVVAPNPTSQDFLQWNGSSWVNSPIFSSQNTFTTNQIISGSTSTDLLRITQTGAGNALVVEDSANPDSTPFVIDAGGRTIVGHTVPVATRLSTTSVTSPFQVLGISNATSSILNARFSNDTTGPITFLAKSRGSIGSFTTVVAADQLGVVSFAGADGTQMTEAARLTVLAEGTVSTGVVPGFLTISTANTSGTLTERMRIDSLGRVTIGGTATAGQNLRVATNATGSTTARQIFSLTTVQSDVTSTFYSISSFVNTQAASFTLDNLYHFHAQEGTIGAGSTVTNQTGFVVGTGLIGATNNFGFRGAIASGTGRWNLYMDGTAVNYLAGRLGVGATLTSGAMAQITNTTAGDTVFVVKGAASQTGDLIAVNNSAGTKLWHINSSNSIGHGVTTATTTGFIADAGLVAKTSAAFGPQYVLGNKTNDANAGYIILEKDRAGAIVSSGDFLGNIQFRGYDGANYRPAAMISGAVDTGTGTDDMPGRLTFSTTADGTSTLTERMRIDSAGAVGIGTTPAAGRSFTVGKTITGSTTSIAVLSSGTIQSDVTSEVASFRSNINTAAASFTLTALSHYQVVPTATAGSGSTITSQFGFNVASTMTGATNNYGFYGDIAAATGRYNLYMNGTADNYLAGSLGIGGTPAAGRTLTLAKPMTGAVSSFAVLASYQVASDVISTAESFRSNPNTAAASFTLANLIHFRATQATIGAGSAVTTQYGFWADSTMTGATTNIGYFGNLAASAAARFNLYMDGTAPNYLLGRVGIGTTSSSGPMLLVQNTNASDGAVTIRGAASQTGSLLSIQNSASVVLATVDASGRAILGHTASIATGGVNQLLQVHHTLANVFLSRWSANASGSELRMGKSRSATIGSYSAVSASDVLATINGYGDDGTQFILAGNVAVRAEGTISTGVVPGRLEFATANSSGVNTERMRIDSAGAVGIGTTTLTGRNLRIGKALTGSTVGISVYANHVINSDVTSSAAIFQSQTSTQAASFTLPSLTHFFVAGIATPGAGSTITTQMGFYVDSNLTGATNNYAFHGDVAAATGRWNFYANGTARNYFAGGLEVVAGTTSMTTGFTHVPAAAGAPTGAPTNPTGNTPLYYDTTNNKLYVYNGAWKSVSLT